MLAIGLPTTTAFPANSVINMDFKVRRASIDDIDDMVFIEDECFSTPWSKKSFLESFSHSPWHFFVATCDERVVGYGGVYLILDEGQISNIAVLNKYRKNGLGKAILESIFSVCRENGCERVTLELRESNSPARALYESCGFTEVGRRPNFYSSPIEAAILMDKKL